MHSWPVNRAWHPWQQKAMHHPVDGHVLSDTVQDVIPETLTPKKNHTSIDPKLGQHSNERGDKWAHKRQAKEKGNGRKEVETNGRQMSMEEDGRHQTKPGKQKETKARRGKHSHQSSGTNEGRQRPRDEVVDTPANNKAYTSTLH